MKPDPHASRGRRSFLNFAKKCNAPSLAKLTGKASRGGLCAGHQSVAGQLQVGVVRRKLALGAGDLTVGYHHLQHADFKPQALIERDGFFVCFENVEPDGPGLLLLQPANGALHQFPANSQSPVVGLQVKRFDFADPVLVEATQQD